MRDASFDQSLFHIRLRSSSNALFWLGVTMVVIGIAAYYGAVLVLGTSFVRNLGIPLNDTRLRKLTILPYISAIVLISVSGLLNPIGIQLVWQSALPATGQNPAT